MSEPSERIDRASRAVYEDGVIDNWTQDKNTVIGDEAVNELVDGT